MTQPACLGELLATVWPTIFAIDFSRYLIAAGAFAATLALFAKPLASRRIQSSAASRQDVRREIVYSIATILIFSLVGFGVYVGSGHGIFKIYNGDLPGGGRLLFEIVAIVLLHDVYFYWLHRAMHTRWLFRWVHRLHHQSRTPTPWAAYAFAPLEAVLEASIVPLGGLLISMHEVTVFLFVTFMIVRNVIGHAGVELFPGWWLKAPLVRHVTTTTHQDLHHTNGACNFGLYFTWWDRWMKTEHLEYQSRFESVTHKTRVARDRARSEKRSRKKRGWMPKTLKQVVISLRQQG